MSESIAWTRSRVEVANFMNLLACKKCKQRPLDPVKLKTCEHLFCHSCINKESKCFVCQIPFQPSDLRHDFITANIVSACDLIVDIIFNEGDTEQSASESEEKNEKETQIERQNEEKNEKPEEKEEAEELPIEIEEQKNEFKNKRGMEKENRLKSLRQKKPQIDIKKYRNNTIQRDNEPIEDESVKKQKKVENLKKMEKQKEIEFAKLKNIEKRNIKQQEKIDEQQCDLDYKESQNDLFKSLKLSTVFHNTRSQDTEQGNIIQETPTSTQMEKEENPDDDTVILTETDGLESTRNTGFNVPKISKATTSKKRTSRRSSTSSLKAPTIPKNVNRKNKKGETLLHQACLKKQEDTVELLLNNGANPNTKDNANWTPLQEAVTLGYYRICEMLLENGASPNIPGIDNKTALHDAVIHNQVKEAELLLRFEANPNVFDHHGKRPIDYCQSDEMRKLLSKENLLNDSKDLNCSLSSSFAGTSSKIIVLANNLQPSTKESLSELALKHKFKIVNCFQSNVTHVVVESDPITFPNYDLLLSVLHGKWILSSEWIGIGLSMEGHDLREMDLDIFETKFCLNDETPKRARMNAELQNPKLFNNCSFYFALTSNDLYPVGQMELSKKNLVQLCKEGGGCSLTREPNPEGISDQRIPFHVVDNVNHPLHNCSHYIIYSPGKDEPRVKYNMPHIKTLPLVWFIECIEKFALVDPALFGIV